jgi:hypothetical protein
MFENFHFNERERRKYDWRSDKSEAPDGYVLEEPFVVAREYLKRKLPDSLVGVNIHAS